MVKKREDGHLRLVKQPAGHVLTFEGRNPLIRVRHLGVEAKCVMCPAVTTGGAAFEDGKRVGMCLTCWNIGRLPGAEFALGLKVLPGGLAEPRWMPKQPRHAAG